MAERSNIRMLTTATQKYQLTDKISRHFKGKFEYLTIYKAIRLSDQAMVNIKQIHKNTQILNSLVQNEIKCYKIANQHKQSNLLKMLDYSEDTNNHYIITPYCNQGTLTNYINCGDLMFETTILECFRQLCHGVRALHAKNIFLKGLRTDDILANDQDGKITLFISNYGLSQSIDRDEDNLTILATQPPEAYNGTFGVESDIYSLGCVLFKMLTGKELGLGNTKKEMIELQKNTNYVKVETKYSLNLSELALNIIEGCLQADAKNRITMDELASLLDLNCFITHYKPLNLGERCVNLNISTAERSRRKTKTVDFSKLIELKPLSPTKEIGKSNESAKQSDINDIKEELQQIKSMLSSTKARQDQYDANNKEKDESIFILKMELEKLNKEYIYTRPDQMQAQIKIIADEMTRYTADHKKMSESIDCMRADINGIATNRTIELTEMKMQFKQSQSAFAEGINSQQNEINQIKNTLGNDKYSTDISKLQAAINQIQSDAAQNLSRYSTGYQQLIDITEKNSTGLIEIKSTLESLKSQPWSDDITKLQVEIRRIAEDASQKIASSANEISHIKTKQDKYDELLNDIKNTQLQVEQIDVTVSKHTNELKSSADNMASQKNEIKQTMNSIETIKIDTEEIKSSIKLIKTSYITDELNKVIAQFQDTLNQRISKCQEESKSAIDSISGILAGIKDQSLSDIAELKQALIKYDSYPLAMDKIKSETMELRNIVSEIKVDVKQEDISKLQVQINGINDKTNSKISTIIADFKQADEYLQKEISELQSGVAALNKSTITDDMHKLNEHIHEMQEFMNSKLAGVVKDVRSLFEIAERLKLDSIEFRKAIITMDTLNSEVNKLDSEFYKIEEINCKVDESFKSIRVINMYVEKIKTESMESKKEIEILKLDRNAVEIQKLQAHISQLADEIDSRYSTLSTAYSKQINELTDRNNAEIDGVKKQFNTLKAEYATEISKAQVDVSQLQESNNKVQLYAKDSQELANKLQTELYEAQTAIASLKNTEPFTNEVNALKNQLLQLQESINQKSASYSNDAKNATQKIDNIKESISEIAHISSEVKECKANVNKLQYQYNVIQESMIQRLSNNVSPLEIAKLQNQHIELETKLNQRISALNNGLKDKIEFINPMLPLKAELASYVTLAMFKDKCNSIQADIGTVKSTIDFKDLTACPLIQDMLSRLLKLEGNSVILSSPKSEYSKSSYSFKDENKKDNKIEYADTKFIISDTNGTSISEIKVSDIVLVRLDEANKCVVISNRLQFSPTKSAYSSLPPSKGGVVSTLLYSDTLAEATELYKFIRNTHIFRSEKKQLQ